MYVPERRMTNEDMAKIVDTSDQWIQERSGIKERRIIAKDQANSDLSVKAIENAFEGRDFRPEEIDLIVVATVTPDMMFPSNSRLPIGRDRPHHGLPGRDRLAQERRATRAAGPVSGPGGPTSARGRCGDPSQQERWRPGHLPQHGQLGVCCGGEGGVGRNS